MVVVEKLDSVVVSSSSPLTTCRCIVVLYPCCRWVVEMEDPAISRLDGMEGRVNAKTPMLSNLESARYDCMPSKMVYRASIARIDVHWRLVRRRPRRMDICNNKSFLIVDFGLRDCSVLRINQIPWKSVNGEKRPRMLQQPSTLPFTKRIGNDVLVHRISFLGLLSFSSMVSLNRRFVVDRWKL